MIFADYKGQIYKCSIARGGKQIRLLSDTCVDGFEKGITGYVKKVDKADCDRVYKKELCFRHMNDAFLVLNTEDERVLLESGPRSYDLTEIGFERKQNDVFQKWVNKNEGEMYWNETDY